MPRPKKDGTAIALKIATSINNQLNMFCEDSGLTKTAAIERALIAYMDDYYSKQELIKRKTALVKNIRTNENQQIL